MNHEEKKVMRTIKNMTAAFHAGDIEGVMDTYEKNALIVFEPETPVTNEQQLREMFKAIMQLKPKFTYHGHEVFITGEMAMHITPWTMTATTPDGNIINQAGLSIAVLRKQRDGEWLMVFDNPHGQFLLDQFRKQ